MTPQTSQPPSGPATRPLFQFRTTCPVSPRVAPRRTQGPALRGQISRPAVVRRRGLRGTSSECASRRLFVWRRMSERDFMVVLRASVTCRLALCGMWGRQDNPRHGPAKPSSAAFSSGALWSPQFTPALLRPVIPAKCPETHTSHTLIAQGLAVSIRLLSPARALCVHRRRTALSPNLKRTSVCVSGKHVLRVRS